MAFLNFPVNMLVLLFSEMKPGKGSCRRGTNQNHQKKREGKCIEIGAQFTHKIKEVTILYNKNIYFYNRGYCQAWFSKGIFAR